MSKDKKGWLATDYDFDEIYDCGINANFIYKDREYKISCEEDGALYDYKTGEMLWHFSSKEEFYSGVIFGRPIKDVIDDSYLLYLS